MIKYELTSEVIELAPATTAVVTLKVINHSPIIDQFSLYLEPVNTPLAAGLDPDWVTFSLTTFSLRPMPASRNSQEGENQQTVSVTLTLPPSTTAGAYDGRIIIAAGSGQDNSLAIPFHLVVSKIEKEAFELQPPQRVSRSGTEVYRVYLQNQGNAPRLYSLFAEDAEDACRYEILPAEVVLDQGQEAALTLKVKPRQRNWASAEINYDFVLNMEGMAQKLPGSFTQRCALPPVYWLKRHVALLIMLMVLLLAAFVAAFIFLFPLFNPPVASVCAPSSGRLVSVVSNDLNTSIFVSGRAGTDPMTKITTESSETLPGLFQSLVSISADGRRMAYVTARNEALDDARIWVVDIDTKQRRLLTSVPGGLWPTAPVWSSDGELLAFVKYDKAATTATASTTTAAATKGSPTPEVATTTAAANATTAAPAAKPTQLQLWVVKPGEEAKQVASPAKLDVNLFYGDASPVVCWSATNTSLLIRPKPGADVARLGFKTDEQLEISYPEGKINEVIYNRLTLPGKPNINIPSVPRIGMIMPPGENQPQNEPKSQAKTPTSSSGKNSSAGVANASCPTLRPYSQLDPQWGSLPLKLGTTSKLGDSGCAITAAAILLNQYGVDTTPAEVVGCLGDLTSPLTPQGWSVVGQRCGGGRLNSGGRNDFSWEELDAELQKGPAIVGLLGGQTGTHFVVVTGGADGIASSYTVTDPWDGTTYKTLDLFLNLGYRMRWLVAYSGPELSCGGISQLGNNQSGLQIQVSGVTDGGLYQAPVSMQYEVIGNPSVISATARFTPPKSLPGDVSQRNLPNNQPIPLDQDGVYNVGIQAKGVGDTPPVASRNLFFTIDRTPPTLGHTILTAPDPKSGKFTTAVSILLKANDSLSGVALLEYQVDDGPFRLYSSDTSTSPLVVRDNGTHTVAYRATDGAGNVSPLDTFNFTIELPVASTNANGAAKPGGNGANGLPNGAGGAATTPAVTTVAPVRTTVRPTTVATTVQTPRPTTTAALTTTSAPTTTAATTVATTAAATTTATPSPTVKLVPALAVDLTSITFGPGVLTQTLKISNTGTGTLNWNIVPGTGANALKFSPSGGALAAGANTSLTINLLSASLPLTVQTAAFDISWDNGKQTVAVTINPQILPTATFQNPLAGAVLSTSTSIALTINVPALAKTPDHATLIANYMACITCAPADVTLSLKPNAANNWTVTWDTSLLIPQTAITLSGKLCVSTDESICSQIAAVANLSIPIGATITAPSDNAIISSTTMNATTITGQSTGRADHVTLRVVYQDDPTELQPIPLSFKPTGASWTINTWDTSTLQPGRKFDLKAKVCSSTDDSVCFDITPVRDLQTKMTATVVTSKDFSGADKTLPANLGVTITSPSSNINHVSLYASFKNNITDATATRRWLDTNVITGPGWTTTWITPLFPSQSGVILEALACFTIGETQCAPLTTVPSLVIPTGPAVSIVAERGTPQTADVLGGFFAVPMQVLVKDVNNNPVPSTSITFSAPADVYSTSVPTGSFICAAVFFPSPPFSPLTCPQSIAVTTDANGRAVAPAFYAGFKSGNYTVQASAPGIVTPALFQLANLAPGSTPILASAGDLQTARVLNTYTVNLQATILKSGVPQPGITVSFSAPQSGPSGTFAGTGTYAATAVTDANGIATAPAFTANCIQGSVTVSVSATSGAFAPAFYNLTNDFGLPHHIDATAGTVNLSAQVTNSFTPAFSGTVRDQCGYALPGYAVTLTAPTTGASGTFADTNTNTTTTPVSDAAGLFTAPVFTANQRAGNSYAVVAAVVGFPTATATFSPSNTPGGAAQIVAVSGDAQSTKILTAFASPLVARVSDQYGNPVTSGTLTLTGPSTGASLVFTGPNSNTITLTIDATGTATGPAMTANGTAGNNYAVAATSGTGTLNFTLSNLKGDPSQLVIVAATNNQTTTVNTAFPNNLQAVLRDAGGNTLDGYTVTFTGPSTGAGAQFSTTTNTVTVTSGPNGAVDTGIVRANTKAGANYTVGAVVTGFPAVTATYTLSNVPGAAANIAVVPSTNNQTATIRTLFGTQFAVTVTDLFGNIVPAGTLVDFNAPAPTVPATASGSFTDTTTSATQASTNAAGIATAATFRANNRAGTYTVTASLNGVVPAVSTTFSLTNLRGAPANLTITGGSGQSAVVNANFATSLQADLTDSGGNLLDGYTIVFTAPTTGASVTFNSTTTNTTSVLSGPSGAVDSLTFKANTKSGNVTITAAVTGFAGVNTNFTATVLPGPAANIAVNTGNNQSQVILTAFSLPLSVLVTDSFNNPVAAGTNVTFTAPASGASGTFASSSNNVEASVATNASGIATSSVFTANGTAGAYSVVASLTATPATSTNFSLTNNKGVPATLTITGGSNNQSATVATAFGTNLQALLVDAGGNTLDTYSVTFTGPASGASVIFPASTTNVTTVTSAGGGLVNSGAVQANTVAGANYSVVASVVGYPLVTATYTLTNNAGAPASLTVVASTNNQSTVVSTPFTTQLAATVLDQYSNPVPGVNVDFVAPTTGASGTFQATGTATDNTKSSNATGVVTASVFTANATPGSYSVVANVQSLPAITATFSLRNQGLPAAIFITGGNGQTRTVNTAFSPDLSVRVEDSLGNTLNGYTVNFSGPATGASVNFTTTGNNLVGVVTAGGGLASAGGLSANTVAGGPYNISATVAGFPAVTINFTATNTPGPAAAITVAGGSSPQSAKIVTAFATALSVQVSDSFGNPVGAGTNVTFTAPATGASGTFASSGTNIQASVATNASGIATASTFTANTSLGNYNVVASLTATPAVTRNLALTNMLGNPASLTVVAVTNNQSARVNTSFGSNLQAIVKDAGGNTLTGIAVTFTAPSTGASVVFGVVGSTISVTSGTGGVADSGPFIANNTSGTNYTIVASVNLFPAVTVNFTATNTPDVAAYITAVNAGATPQSTARNTAFGVVMSVVVTDQFGNVVPGATVRFTKTTSGGGATGAFATATPLDVVTNATGVANPGAFTANNTAGNYTVTATIVGSGPPLVTLVFNLTNT